LFGLAVDLQLGIADELADDLLYDTDHLLAGTDILSLSMLPLAVFGGRQRTRWLRAEEG
jgi:hypothetical protein